MGIERTERQYPYALASIGAYALYALAHLLVYPPQIRPILFASSVAAVTWLAAARDNIQPLASKAYVLIRYVLFSILCLLSAAAKLASIGVHDSWLFIGGAALLATAIRVVMLPNR